MSQVKEKTLPVYTIRRGACRASIWANETDCGVRHAVTLDRRYCGNDGVWRSTKNLDRDALLLAAEILREAASWIYAEEESLRKEKRAPLGDEGATASTHVSSPASDSPF